MATEEHSILCYGLSTCIHCRHAREFLEQNKEKYDFIYVDLLKGTQREEAIEQVRRYNPDLSFPTIVIDDGKRVIVGFRQAELTKALGL